MKKSTIVIRNTTFYLLRGSGGFFQLLMLRSDGKSVHVDWDRYHEFRRPASGPGISCSSTGGAPVTSSTTLP